MKVLLVEDNSADAYLLRETLSGVAGGPVEFNHVETLAGALARLRSEPFDIVLMDLSLPDAEGLETIQQTQEAAPDIPIVVLTGRDDEALALGAVRQGAQDYLVKGQDDGQLVLRAMRYAIERKRSEEAIREANEKLRAVINTSPLAIYTLDFEARVKSWNAAAERMFGYQFEEILDQPLPTIPPQDQETTLQGYARILDGEEMHGDEARRRRKDGQLIWVNIWTTLLRDASGKASGFLAAVADITERKQLEEQLRQAQRMEAVGRLAGGVAHDFNNLLTIITGYSDILLNKTAADGPLHKYVEEIQKAAGRAGSLTNQLLAFSRRQVLQPKVIDLNEIVADMHKMLRRLIPENIELIVNLDAQAGPVRADPGQIEQVILNLVLNAREAMPDGGKLILETAGRELDEGYCRQHVSIGSGRYVMLSVTDTGYGMPSEVKAHIFEPFFTTKTGKGTGLGLATVYGIVRQSNGDIWVYSEPGRGSCFKVYLPLSEAAGPVFALPPAAPPAVAGIESVLLVEDEITLRQLVGEILRERGYSVMEAANGVEALEIVRSPEVPIDLLLTDVVMPLMSGRELAEKVPDIRPGTRILFMSGYTDDAVVKNGLITSGSYFIQKPFTPDALAEKIRAILDTCPERGA